MRNLALASLILCLLPRAGAAQTIPPEASIAWGDAFSPRANAANTAANAVRNPVTSATPHPSVARIIVPNRDGMAFGSGTLVDARGKHGLVLTNWHVVEDASDEITVRFPDGFVSGARLLKADKLWDLAALAVWRPNCTPVPLAQTPPQPGEWLAIAGYGHGTYRFISGNCTHYFAPKTNYPLELVELSVAARQGDSGGPIFNQRGELAGVLFGASYNTTMGSYCGRVKQFMATVLPPEGGDEKTQIAALPAATPQGETKVVPLASPAAPVTSSAGSSTFALGPTAPALQPLDANRFLPAPTQGGRESISPWRSAEVSTTTVREMDSRPLSAARTRSAAAPSPPAAPDELTWEQIAGKTPLEQGKTILAAIGGLALVVLVLRWSRT